MSQLPQVAEIVLGSRGGAGSAVGLHGQPGQAQPLHETPEGVGLSCGEGVGIGQGRGHPRLHQAPHVGVDGFHPGGVGQDPVGATGDLRRQVAVARGRQVRRGGRRDVQVHDDHRRGLAGAGDLHPLAAHRRPGTGVAVHRRGGADAGVVPAQFEGRQLHQVVEGARPDRHRHRVPQRVPDPVGVVLGRVQHRAAREDQRLGDRGSGTTQRFLDGLPGHREGVLVGDDLEGPGAEVGGDQLACRGQHPAAHRRGDRVGGAGERVAQDVVRHCRSPAVCPRPGRVRDAIR